MTQTSNSLSIYKDELTKDGLAKGMARILKAFPKFNKNQLEILRERFKELKFSDKRIMDAVNFVIDNYQGWDKLPNLANFLQYDKKALTYFEVLEFVNQGESMANFEIINSEKKTWRRK